MMSHRTRRGFRPALDALENRRVPTVVVFGGTLLIEGGTGHDVAEVKSHGASQYKVTLNNANFYVNRDAVDLIKFYGGNGSDTFRNWTNEPSRAWGGNGNDDLIGGGGDDRLYGENGIDQLWGLDGDDYLDGGLDTAWNELYGGDGNDTMSGGNGPDFMYGNNGNDAMLGRDGEDWMYGGAGVDHLHGQAGNDKLDGGDDGYQDFLVGGAGADRFQLDQADGDVFVDFDLDEDDSIYNDRGSLLDPTSRAL